MSEHHPHDHVGEQLDEAPAEQLDEGTAEHLDEGPDEQLDEPARDAIDEPINEPIAVFDEHQHAQPAAEDQVVHHDGSSDDSSGDDAGPDDSELVTDDRIAAAVARLDTLDERPPAEHVEVYEEVHAVLQDSLAQAQGDQRPQAPGGAGQ